MATAITANHGAHVIPHVLRESKGAKKHQVLNAPTGKINFSGTDEDWVKMRDAMVDVIQSGTGRGIRTPMYQIAGKTGTAQVKSIAQGKRYNEALLTSRQLDHGLFVGFAPAENPEIAISVIWENGKHGGSAAQLAKPVFDYWMLTRKKNPIAPLNHQVSGGLMTAGIKPGELPNNDIGLSTAQNAAQKPKPNAQNPASAPSHNSQSNTTHQPNTTARPATPPETQAEISE